MELFLRKARSIIKRMEKKREGEEGGGRKCQQNITVTIKATVHVVKT